MKKLILFAISVALSLSLFSQERVNREKLTFEKSSKVLKNATGWAYNSTSGEWIKHKNFISNRESAMVSSASQNFIKIQTKTVNYNDTMYYVLIIEKWHSYYKYPNIQQGLVTHKLTQGFIFTESEYSKLFDIENLIELKTKYVVKIDKYDEQNILDLIQTTLQKNKKEFMDFIFPILKSSEGNIRFYVPSLKYDFDKAYFETTLENFSKIIIQ